MKTFFDLDVDSHTRGHSFKTAKQRSKFNIRKFFFSERVVQRWNNLSQEDIDNKTLNGFKKALVTMRRSQMDFFMD